MSDSEEKHSQFSLPSPAPAQTDDPLGDRMLYADISRAVLLAASVWVRYSGGRLGLEKADAFTASISKLRSILAVQQSAHKEIERLKRQANDYIAVARAAGCQWRCEACRAAGHVHCSEADRCDGMKLIPPPTVQSVAHDGRQEEQKKELRGERTSATEGDAASVSVHAPELPHDGSGDN